MRNVALICLTSAAVLLAGCGGQEAPPQESKPPSPTTSAAPEVPPSPEPSREADCPYLDTAFVGQANGQRVSKVEVSADTPHPACFFYALTGKRQLTVRVYTGEPAVARALVDQVAPVATSNPAKQPAGWEGGYLSGEDGAVYAVAKDGSAVVVTTNQQQSVKARTVATKTITTLGL